VTPRTLKPLADNYIPNFVVTRTFEHIYVRAIFLEHLVERFPWYLLVLEMDDEVTGKGSFLDNLDSSEPR
jgi:hypothetical protein